MAPLRRFSFRGIAVQGDSLERGKLRMRALFCTAILYNGIVEE